MTTREIYFKNICLSDLPVGLIGYTYKDKNNVIQIGKSVCVEFGTDENIVEKSINTMKNIQNEDGFMFWNSSIEGEKFFKDNWNVISDVMLNILLKQK